MTSNAVKCKISFDMGSLEMMENPSNGPAAKLPTLHAINMSGPDWTSLDQCGRVWTNMNKPGQVLVSLDKHGRVWTSLGKSGQVLTSLDESRRVWTILDKSGQVWVSLNMMEYDKTPLS